MAPEHEDNYFEQPPVEVDETETDTESDDQAGGSDNTWSNNQPLASNRFVDGSPALLEHFSTLWSTIEEYEDFLDVLLDSVPTIEQLQSVFGNTVNVQPIHVFHNEELWDTTSSSSTDDESDEGTAVDDGEDRNDDGQAEENSDFNPSEDEEEPGVANTNIPQYSDDEDEEAEANNGNMVHTANKADVRDANDFNSDEDSIPLLINFNPRPTEEERAQNLSQQELGDRRERRFWFALQNFFSDNEEQVVPKKAKPTEPESAPEREPQN